MRIIEFSVTSNDGVQNRDLGLTKKAYRPGASIKPHAKYLNLIPSSKSVIMHAASQLVTCVTSLRLLEWV